MFAVVGFEPAVCQAGFDLYENRLDKDWSLTDCVSFTVMTQRGLTEAFWSIDTLDWQGPADDVLITQAVEQPRAGSIVLLHDIHPGTARTTGAVLDGLLDRGFQLVTVRQLFGGQLPAAGSWRRAP